MPRLRITNRQRILRLTVASAAFMLGASAIIVLVIRMYLLPAYEAWAQADPTQKTMLSASSALLLAVVLVVLFVLLITAFGARRYFFPSDSAERTRTQYVDAWAESAKRVNPIDTDPPPT